MYRRLSRSLFAAILVSGTALAVGCGLGADASLETSAATTDPITDIPSTWVRRQTIGNCWLYATASWAESLNKATLAPDEPMPDGAVTSVILSPDAGDAGYTGPEPWRPTGLNLSESYWTYWHWFDQIANGTNSSSEITTGGYFATAVEIISRYGLMKEADFIDGEKWFESSPTQKRALAHINESLKTGALKDRGSRRDRALVRAELDRAFELPPEIIARMDAVFGRSVSRTLDRSQVRTEGSGIIRSSEIPVILRDPTTKAPVERTLADAIGTRGASGMREGPFAWNQVSYPNSPSSRRSLQIRMQRAMHDRQPVVMSWQVDFNAIDPQGRLVAPPEEPGAQGGHMVVADDYQVTNVPGFGTLPAGAEETRPAALAAALAPSAAIEFIRVKNSWGTYRADPSIVAGGYHDLYMKYLNGPMKFCEQNAEGTDSTDDCYDGTPLKALVLPAGY